MEFLLREEQRAMQKLFREFADREIQPGAAERDEGEVFPREILQKMGRQGFMGIPLPEEWGGGGADFLTYILAVEEFSRACASTGIIVAVHTSLVAMALLAYGTREQKEKYLPRVASGELLGAYALTEPGAGSDAASLRTIAAPSGAGSEGGMKDRDGGRTRESSGSRNGDRAESEIRNEDSSGDRNEDKTGARAGNGNKIAYRNGNGDGYILRGNKIFITSGGEADLYLVFATLSRERGREGITAFIVEKDTPGLSFGGKEKKMGLRASSTTEVVLDDCPIPAANRLGGEREGFKIAMSLLDGGRIGVGAQALGIARAAFQAARDYAKTREQFGRPISRFQAVSFKLADMATRIEAARLLVYQAADLKGKNLPCGKEASMAKLFATDTAMQTTIEAVQVLGGYGYSREYPVERLFRDAKVTQIYEGTNQIQRLVIGKQI